MCECVCESAFVQCTAASCLDVYVDNEGNVCVCVCSKVMRWWFGYISGKRCLADSVQPTRSSSRGDLTSLGRGRAV